MRKNERLTLAWFQQHLSVPPRSECISSQRWLEPPLEKGTPPRRPVQPESVDKLRLRIRTLSDSGCGIGWVVRVCEILHVPLEKEFLFSLLSSFPVHLPHWPSKTDVLGALFLMQNSRG